MIQWLRKDIKCKITAETILAVTTVYLMWICYYIDQKGIFQGNPLWEIGIWGLGIVVIMNVCFPAWWIVRRKQEGVAGMGITKKNLPLALLFSLLLGALRFPELLPYIKDISDILPVLLFNLLSIWEVCFIFSWLYTRFEKAFGQTFACILTALSVGIYHIGSLQICQIASLMLYVFLCSICFSTTKNIFTVWPVYWIIGCSASVLKAYGAERFPWEMVSLMGLTFLLHILSLVVIKARSSRSVS